MSRVSKIHNYAILWLNNQGVEIINIADELKLTEKQVKSVLENGVDDKVSKNTPVKTVKSSANSKSKNMMITNKDKGIAIMTKEASQLNDEVKKPRQLPTRYSNDSVIYRPKG